MGSQGITLEKIGEGHDAIIDSWYAEKGLPIPPKWMRGNLAFVARRNGALVACAHLIPGNGTEICFLEFVQTNPKLSIMTQARGLLFIIRCMIEFVKASGFRAIMGFVPQDLISLRKFYDRIGGKVTTGLDTFYMEVSDGN